MAPPALKRLLVRVPPVLGRTADAVLMYHSVGEGGGGAGAVSPERFRSDLAHLTACYDVVDLPAIAASTAADRRRVALTFDDGYADFYDTVRPLLHEFGVPATVFVVANTLTDPDFEHDAVGGPYMTPEQVRELVGDALVTVGNHTLSHPRLSSLDRAEIHREILAGKRTLESHLDTSVERFCYPYGDYDERVLNVVRHSHQYAVAVDDGTVPATPDRHCLPRLDGTIPSPVLRADIDAVRRRVARAVSG